MPEAPKRCLCYIRGWRYKKKRTKDANTQALFLRAEAEMMKYNNIKVVAWVGYKGSSTYKQSDHLLECAEYCKKNSADFIYIELSKWRPDSLLNEYLRRYNNGEKKTPSTNTYKVIKLDAPQEIIDEIERHARFEKYDKNIKHKTKTRQPKKGSFEYCWALWEKAKQSKDELALWKFENNINTRRMNNFKHLCAGADSIYKEIEKNNDLSPKAIADKLHKNYYITAEGKRWSRDSVIKAQKIFLDPDFIRYLDAVSFKKRESEDDV